MKRREFITLLGGATVWPMPALAQQGERIRRVGVLVGFAENDAETRPRLQAFRDKLHELGWVEGRNVEIIPRWGTDDVSHVRANAAELVALEAEVILAHSPPVLAVLQQTTRTVPIVFVQVTDPLGSRFVSSMTRPGGNITGFETFEFAMSGKWLQVLKELKPDLARAAILHDPDNPAWPGRLAAIEQASSVTGVRALSVAVRDLMELEQALAALAIRPGSGIVVMPDNRAFGLRQRIVELAVQFRLPAIYPFRYFVANGGLMSYGVDLLDIYRAGATYVDRILKGEKPADLPVQAPTKYELVINLKTAKVLGLDIPPTLLARADEVIE
jgi:ABC-type uncharacterized transport system substrate-binding protein